MAEVSIGFAESEIIKLAQDLIDDYHEHLQGARILWLTTTSKRTRGGHVVLGSAGKSNPLQRFLSGHATSLGGRSSAVPHDYIVQIDINRWRRALATQRSALIDHLLCRMIQKEHVNRRTGETTYSWGTVGPDVEEFSDVIRRHGMWLPAQQVFAKAVRETGVTLRIKFPDLEEDEEDETEQKEPTVERVTTVDASGVVEHTERIPGDADVASNPSAVGDETASGEPQSPSPGPSASTDPKGAGGALYVTDSDGSTEVLTESTNGRDEIHVNRVQDLNGHTHAGSDDASAPGWRETAGVGVSDIEVARGHRRRGTRSSEQSGEPAS